MAVETKIGANGMIENIDTSTLNDSSSAVSSVGLDPKTVSDMLQADIGSISSSNETIDSGINAAIASQRESAKANEDRLMSAGERESGYLLNKLQNERTSMLEAGRGGAVGSYALLQVDKEIDKSLKDLDMRKNELILQGNAAAAAKISDLQVQQLTLKADAQQRHFTNLLGLGGYQENVNQRLSQEKQQARQMTMDQLRYNIDLRQQAAYEKKSEFEMINDTARLNIQRAELKISQARESREAKLDNVPADPGWASSAIQVKIMGEIAPQLYAISAQLKEGAISEDEARAQRALLYAKQRGVYPRGAVTDDALTEAIFGIPSVEDQYQQELSELNIPGAYGGQAAGTGRPGFLENLSNIFGTQSQNRSSVSNSDYRQLQQSGFKFK